MNSTSPKKVLLLLCQGAETLEASAFIDVMGWSTSLGSTAVEVTTTSPRSTTVTCTFGLRLFVDRLLSDVNPADFDALAIPGGFEAFDFYTDAYSVAVQNLLRQFAVLGKPIAAICVAALAVGNAGLLNGRRATTYHLGGGRRRRQLSEFGALVVDQALVEDGLFITSSSPATAVDVALRLLAAITGEANAQHVRCLMGFGHDSAG